MMCKKQKKQKKNKKTCNNNAIFYLKDFEMYSIFRDLDLIFRNFSFSLENIFQNYGIFSTLYQCFGSTSEKKCSDKICSDNSQVDLVIKIWCYKCEKYFTNRMNFNLRTQKFYNIDINTSCDYCKFQEWIDKIKIVNKSIPQQAYDLWAYKKEFESMEYEFQEQPECKCGVQHDWPCVCKCLIEQNLSTVFGPKPRGYCNKLYNIIFQ